MIDLARLKPVPELTLAAGDAMPTGLLEAAQPKILKGFVRQWPMVEAGATSAHAFQQHLMAYYNQRPVHLMQADAEHKGRLFYNDDLSGFNFTRQNIDLNEVFNALANGSAEGAADNVADNIAGNVADSSVNKPANNPAKGLKAQPTMYVGSTAVDSVFPGLRAQNDLPFLSDKALVSIWMGNQSRIAAHYDAPDNIACVVHGKRRFILFPPQQIDNLYVGPIDFTPAGQPASLVDFHQADYTRFPRFKTALEHAFVAELEAGDAIYIPATWWHHVEALSDFNALVNYWWRQVDNHVGNPSDALMHAMLSIRSLPTAQRAAWQRLFDHYIFNPQDNAHIPDHALGCLAETDPLVARKLRALLINHLNR